MRHEPPVYFARIMEDDGRPASQLIAEYRQGPGLLREALSGMARPALTARPLEGKWSTLEVLGHIADTEQFIADRMKRTIATDLPLLVGVDGRGYLEALHYQERVVDLQLELVELTRKQMAADLELLDEDDWARQAVHTEVGLVDLRQLLLHATRHLERHIAAIAEKREALGL